MLLASTSRPAKPAAASSRSSTAVAEVVVADVVGDVGDIDAEPDHRRLVADRVDARERSGEPWIADIAVDELGVAG